MLLLVLWYILTAFNLVGMIDILENLFFLLSFSMPISGIGMIAGSVLALFIMIKYDLDLKKYNKFYIISIIISVIAVAMTTCVGLFFGDDEIFIIFLAIEVIALLCLIIVYVKGSKEHIVLFLSSPIVYYTLIWVSIIGLIQGI